MFSLRENRTRKRQEITYKNNLLFLALGEMICSGFRFALRRSLDTIFDYLRRCCCSVVRALCYMSTITRMVRETNIYNINSNEEWRQRNHAQFRDKWYNLILLLLKTGKTTVHQLVDNISVPITSIYICHLHILLFVPLLISRWIIRFYLLYIMFTHLYQS